MKKDKVRLAIMAIITILFLSAALLYGLMITKKEINLGSIIPLAIPLIMIIFMAFLITRRYKDMKEGMPLEDERSRKVITQAAAKSFYASLYWLLFISFFESFFAKMFGSDQLTASQTTGGGIAGMAIFFVVFWFYYNKKGKLV